MKYINISSYLEKKFRLSFLNDHSKFIHSSWLLKEDIDKKSTINGVEWTIVGLWDLAGTRRLILLRSDKGAYAFEDSKIVSEGMGFFNMRNQVTGEEHKNWHHGKRTNLTPLIEESSKENVEETSGVWTSRDNEAVLEDEENLVVEEEDIDPLVKALQSDLSDEDIDY